MTTTTLTSDLRTGTLWAGLTARARGAFARLADARQRRAAPPASRATRAQDEARRVREMAHAVARSDPRFAADLYAAASRHELLNAG